MLKPEELLNKYGIAGQSIEVKEIIAVIEQVAPTDVTVLITGESGTGKEVFANLIHKISRRSAKPFVAVNCGAIPQGILESELFGHEKGSFTGASEMRKGYFESADGGTIFLDEIGEMPLETQVKFLRILETGEYSRVGSSSVRKATVRIIAATNKDLYGEVRRKEFREDLYFRLRAIQLVLPPLRDRKDDILIIAEKFISDLEKKHDLKFQGFTPEASDMLIGHEWPGNIRELRNLIETMLVLERSGRISSDTLAKYLYQGQSERHGLPVPTYKTPEQAERELIYRALLQLQNEMRDFKQMLSQFVLNGGARRDDNIHQQPIINGQQKLLPAAPYESTSVPDPPKGLKEMMEDFYQSKLSSDGHIPSLSELEKFAIEKTLQHGNRSRKQIAKLLGITERTLYRKLKEYNLEHLS